MFFHPQSLPRLDGKGSGPVVGVAGPFGCATLDPVIYTANLELFIREIYVKIWFDPELTIIALSL
jgi:hypothetical protein